MDPDIDYNRFVATSAALEQYRNGEEVDLEPLGAGAQKYIDSVNWIENAAPESVSNWYQMGSEKSAYGLSKYLLDNDLIIKDKVWGLSTETWQNTSGALNTILIEGFTKIIMGEEPVEYFDTIVEDWMNAGGEQATKEVNETYGK